ncbi:hypothetical protein ACFQ6N_39545 [Kitasatospora sp. NPDC056446]|uniref:hypothetical protein n=1 Tax=Kitasatospora sp. NPDC056446 TaxID=3345819 RepID=UPI003692B89E
MVTYKNGRQHHIFDALNHLAQAGVLSWRGEFLYRPGQPSSTALWWVAFGGRTEQFYKTDEVENLIGLIYDGSNIIWEPVPANYGEPERLETLARIERHRKAAGK